MEVRVFIGSSQESLFLAQAIQTELRKVAGTLVQRWDQETFKPSGYPLPDLIETANCYDFGIFVIGPDDIAVIRSKRMYIARDNVVFEAGLFFSQLGRERTFLIKPKLETKKGRALPFHVPSDLAGLNLIEYSPTKNASDLRVEVGGACGPIEEAMNDLGNRRVQVVVKKIDSLSKGSVFLLRHAAKKCYTLSELTHAHRHFHGAQGDTVFNWNKATELAVQSLSLLGLVELKNGEEDVSITELGKEFLGKKNVKEKFEKAFDTGLWIPPVPPKPPVRFTCPSFTLQIPVDQLEDLKKGTIPSKAELAGEGGWEDIFDLPVPPACWKWGDVVGKLESPEPWIHPLAILMWQGYNGESIQYPSVGARIKFANQPDSGHANQPDGGYRVYRLCLQNVTVTGGKAHFAFAAAAVVVPYEPANNPQETGLYHLFNLAWFFRRRLLERELGALDFALSKLPSSEREEREREEKIKNTIRAIDNDFRTLLADSQVRGMEDPQAAINSFNSPLRQEVSTRLSQEWPKLFKKLRGHLDAGVQEAEEIKRTLNEMKEINSFFLKVSIEELNKYLGVQSSYYVLLRHKISAFSQWQAYYEAHAPARRRAGVREVYLWRDLDHLGEIFLLCQADDLMKAREFIASDDLHETMKQAGVVGNPEIYFLQLGRS